MARVALLDVNVIVALFDGEHVHHDIAHDWFDEARHHGWATTPIVENGVLRVLSNRAYHSAALSPTTLRAHLRRFCADTAHVFWPDEVSLLDDDTKLVTSRLGKDRFRVAGTAEFNGANKDIRADRIRPLLEWVNQCFPGVSTRQVVPWAGLRPMMPNMMPHVGAGSKPGIFYNTGHGHLGWTLSAATAEIIAARIEADLPPEAEGGQHAASRIRAVAV